MLISIKSPDQLGLLIRAVRKHQKIRMDDIAGSAGVGPVFVREVERGKETVQLGRVMQILAELGIELRADVPDEVQGTLSALKAKGVKPFTPRKSAAERAAPSRMTPTGQDEK
jgi:transcriptional regulator with XRE-family HTH domain